MPRYVFNVSREFYRRCSEKGTEVLTPSLSALRKTLEDVLQRKLEDSRIARGNAFTEIRTIERGFRVIRVQMVGHIERFSPEFERLGFRDLEHTG